MKKLKINKLKINKPKTHKLMIIKSKFINILVAIFFVLNASACGSIVENATASEDKDLVEAKELTILAAASLMDVTVALKEAYKTIEPSVELVFSYGSSGTLMSQIQEGVEADLFFSAGKKQVNQLQEEELLLPELTRDLLKNKLVLIVPKEEAKTNSTVKLTSFDDVIKEEVTLIGLGDPSGVPVGQYSKAVFEHLGILDQIYSKSNYGSDARQVLTWVEMGEVDCGVVYATDAIHSKRVLIVCEAPEGSHDPIIYPISVLTESKLKR
jgi:molybdate transport system substrate-binding protein